jgi:hypothetical protein
MSAEELNAGNPIKGLAADQITGPVDNLDFYLKDIRPSTSGSCDLYREAIAAREKVHPGSKGHHLEPAFSEDVIIFFKENRPRARLFLPGEIAFLKSMPGVEFEYEQGEKDGNKYEWWSFTSKLPDNQVSLHLSLNQGEVPWYFDRDPYLVVTYFPAKYDNGKVIFTPHVENDMCPSYGWKTEANGTTKSEISDHKKWEKIIIDGLGLKQHVVKQELNFQINDFDVRISLKKQN